MHAPQKAKCEKALQTALDAIEKRLRERMDSGESFNVGISVKASQGLIQHFDFTGTEHVRVDVN